MMNVFCSCFNSSWRVKTNSKKYINPSSQELIQLKIKGGYKIIVKKKIPQIKKSQSKKKLTVSKYQANKLQKNQSQNLIKDQSINPIVQVNSSPDKLKSQIYNEQNNQIQEHVKNVENKSIDKTDNVLVSQDKKEEEAKIIRSLKYWRKLIPLPLPPKINSKLFTLDKGLQNHGNSCYLNSALQCLSKTYLLTEFILSEKKQVSGDIFRSYKHFLQFWKEGNTEQNLYSIDIKDAIGKFNLHFNNSEQKDSLQLLANILDGLNEELKQVLKEQEQEQLIQEQVKYQIIQEQDQIKTEKDQKRKEQDEKIKESQIIITALKFQDSTSKIAEKRGISADQAEKKKKTGHKKDNIIVKFESSSISANSKEIKRQEPKQHEQQGYNQLKQTLQAKEEGIQKNHNKEDQNDDLVEKYFPQDIEAKNQKFLDEQLCIYFANKHAISNNSIITKLFAGQYKTSIKCDICKDNASKGFRTFDSFTILYLPVEIRRQPNNSNIHRKLPHTLDMCFEDFCKKQILEGDNAWYCEKCESDTPSTKQTTIYKTSQYLVIGFKRFKDNRKITQAISYGFQLDMSKFVGDKTQNSSYSLYAVINHYGSLRGGHYTAYCKTKIESNKSNSPKNYSNQRKGQFSSWIKQQKQPMQQKYQWFHFNDSSVSRIEEKQVISKDAYALFYKRND